MMDVASFSIIILLMIVINILIAAPLVYFVKTKSQILFNKMKA